MKIAQKYATYIIHCNNNNNIAIICIFIIAILHVTLKGSITVLLHSK